MTTDGTTITVETAGDEALGASLDELHCIISYLKVPDNVVFRMNHTRAVDGMQDAEWDGYKASWTYHPDNGFALNIEDGIDW